MLSKEAIVKIEERIKELNANKDDFYKKRLAADDFNDKNYLSMCEDAVDSELKGISFALNVIKD